MIHSFLRSQDYIETYYRTTEKLVWNQKSTKKKKTQQLEVQRHRTINNLEKKRLTFVHSANFLPIAFNALLAIFFKNLPKRKKTNFLFIQK